MRCCSLRHHSAELASRPTLNLAMVATTEEIGQEVVRTLVGAIGLVLAVPVTTLIAVWMVPRGIPDDAEPHDGGPGYAGRRVAAPDHG